MIKLDLLSRVSQLRIKKEAEKTLVFDPLRKKWIVLQPEELVRQCLILWLHEELRYPLQRMSAERGLQVQSLSRRYDLLVYDKQLQPWLLAECKAPKVTLTDRVWEQAGQYNWFDTRLRVPYILISNGIETYCSQIHYEERRWETLESLPAWPE
jgi:hypothetical protein